MCTCMHGINEFTTNFVNVVLELAENVVTLNEDKPITKISEETYQLMEKRRKMNNNTENITAKVDFQNYVKLCEKKIVLEDTRRFSYYMIQKIIEENKSLKTAKRNLILGRKRILALKTRRGKITYNQEQILKETVNFYSELYCSPEQISNIPTSSNTNDILLAVLKEVVSIAIKIKKNGKSSRED